MRNKLANGSLRLLGRASLLFLLASCFTFAAEKTWQLPSDSTRASGWSLADLDGDRIADLAAAGPGLREGNRYTHKVQIDLSHSGSTSFDVYGGSASIRLSLRDIDGDHDRDLVVFEPSSSLPVAVWLNDGAGHFTEGNLTRYASAIGHPARHSLNVDLPVNDTSAGLSDDQLSFHALPVVLTPAVASRAPAIISSAVPRSTSREAFAPRGPPSRS